MMKLPTWLEIIDQEKAGKTPTPLENFIFWHEPAGEDEERFRRQLSNALDHVCDAWKSEAMAARMYIAHLEMFIAGATSDFASEIIPNEYKAYLAARVKDE